MADDKCRFFDFITYESFEKVKALLTDEGGDYLISPLHEPDGDNKKKHFHCMYSHGNSTTLKHVRTLIPAELPVNGKIVPVLHPANRMRYYLHLDDPDKQQFPAGSEALTVIRNFPLDLKKPLTSEEKRMLPYRVKEYVREFSICEYAELIDALANYDDDMFQYACNHTIFLGRYLDSRRYSGKGEKQ